MSKELVTIEQSLSLNGVGSSLPTMTPDKIKTIATRMVEMDRANYTAGRSETQTTNQLMTLTMMTDSPYRRLRQCLAQIENKRLALEEAYFNMKKQDIRIQKWSEQDDPMSRLRIEEAMFRRERQKVYLEGALKEIGIFQEAYEEIRRNNNIPENWDERLAEEDEVKHHLRQAFRQAYRSMVDKGHIDGGNAEYLDQFGVHLMVAEKYIGEYIRAVNEQMEAGHMPKINHFYRFLDRMVETFWEGHLDVMKHMGLENLIRDDYLYTEIHKQATVMD